MPQVLVTGSSGFVARALLPALCRAGYHDLVLMDRNPLPANTRGCLAGVTTEIVANRLPDPAQFPDVGHVICLAGTTSVDAALAEPREALEGNVQIAIDLAEWARYRGRAVRVVYVSSDEVLGEAFSPLPESAPIRPTQPYAASKAAAEIILHCHRDTYGLNIATVRSCNLVGSGQREPKLVPIAVRALLEGNPVPIHGSGEQLREWLAVEDFAQAILKLMDPQVPPKVYHAASGVHLSVLQVADLVAQALEKPLTTVHVADRKVQDRCYAMSAFHLRGLGWQPQHVPPKAIARAARALAAEISAETPHSTYGGDYEAESLHRFVH